jgi:hypothetical protein
MTPQELQQKLIIADNRAKRITDMIRERARKVCREANLDPNLLGIHPHNAMCGFESGNPWPEVNYQKCRLTLHLLQRMFEPHRIYNRYAERLIRDFYR